MARNSSFVEKVADRVLTLAARDRGLGGTDQGEYRHRTAQERDVLARLQRVEGQQVRAGDRAGEKQDDGQIGPRRLDFEALQKSPCAVRRDRLARDEREPRSLRDLLAKLGDVTADARGKPGTIQRFPREGGVATDRRQYERAQRQIRL
jgi:hypothetical protein